MSPKQSFPYSRLSYSGPHMLWILVTGYIVVVKFFTISLLIYTKLCCEYVYLIKPTG